MEDIKIEQIKNKNFDIAEGIVNEYNFKPYYYLKQLSEGEKRKLSKGLILNALSEPDNLFLVAKDKTGYKGFILAERLGWDSSFFGFNCYKIEHICALGNKKDQIYIKKLLLDYIFNLRNEKEIKYVTAKIDTNDISSVYALELKGFNLLCAIAHFNYPAKKPRRHFKQFGRIRNFRESDLKILQIIAKSSMKYDHFHTDVRFPKEIADNIYAALIGNCCRGVGADKVFVMEKNGRIAGYAICQIRHDLSTILPISIGHIRHLAVLYPEGFGCGPGLQEAALSWLEERVDIIESATTIQNLPIIRISLHSGMEIVSSYLRFSRWFKTEPA